MSAVTTGAVSSPTRALFKVTVTSPISLTAVTDLTTNPALKPSTTYTSLSTTKFPALSAKYLPSKTCISIAEASASLTLPASSKTTSTWFSLESTVVTV